VSYIPRQLFKVNILNHGYVEPVFERSKESLNLSVPTDKAIYDLQEAHLSWRIRNPAYPIHYFDLHSCRDYIHTYFHPIFLRAFDCIEAYTGKGNLFKYLVVYREGGWYSDWKQVCLVDNLLDKLSTPYNNTDGHLTNVTFFAAQQISRKDCYQNAFYGATPQHPVLSNVIRRTLQNVQSKFYGSNPYETTGVCVFGQAVIEEGYGVDMANTSRIGRHRWAAAAERNIFKFGKDKVVQHKCTSCGNFPSDWADGNDYKAKWTTKEYYCPDAATLFEGPM
jgi:hypothetical protein